MKILFECEFGSHLYGTNGPNSDKDYKGVCIPDKEDILLGKAPKSSYHFDTKTSSTTKNSSDDVDKELYTLKAFFRLCEEGQTVAYELLFCPRERYISTSPEWEEIIANRNKLLHKNIAAFIGYARQQAAKYGLKGGRVAALRSVLDYLDEFDDNTKVNDYPWDMFVEDIGSEYVNIVQCKAPNGKLEDHLEVCNRKVPFHAKIKYAKEVFYRIFNEYGKRALMAEKQEGVDWKAISHAVRVCNQAKELLTTGALVFPRPDAELLKDIKYGRYEYKDAAKLIEDGLEELEALVTISKLPSTIDKEWAKEYTIKTYENFILLHSISK